MKIRILKTRPKSQVLPVAAWAIMLFQKMLPWREEAFSHLAIEFLIKGEAPKIIDSSGVLKGVSIREASAFYLKNKIVDSCYLYTDIKESKFLSWTKAQEGKEYDYLQILGLALKTLGFVSLNRFGSNYKKLTCNEVVLSALKEFKNKDFGDPDNYDLIMTWQEVKNAV